MQDIRLMKETRKEGNIEAYWEGAKLALLTEEPPQLSNVPYVEWEAISKDQIEMCPSGHHVSSKIPSISKVFNSNVLPDQVFWGSRISAASEVCQD